jgi:hypothetical protein
MIMRIPILAALLPMTVLAACGGNGGPSMSAVDMDRLEQACAARGGMLIPSGRRYTGEVALDYPCRIHGATNLGPAG